MPGPCPQRRGQDVRHRLRAHSGHTEPVRHGRPAPGSARPLHGRATSDRRRVTPPDPDASPAARSPAAARYRTPSVGRSARRRPALGASLPRAYVDAHDCHGPGSRTRCTHTSWLHRNGRPGDSTHTLTDGTARHGSPGRPLTASRAQHTPPHPCPRPPHTGGANPVRGGRPPPPSLTSPARPCTGAPTAPAPPPRVLLAPASVSGAPAPPPGEAQAPPADGAP